jgi:hypothetical protein
VLRGPQQHPVEIAGLDELRAEQIEAARQRVREREADVDHTVEERDLRQRPWQQVAEPVEHRPDAEHLDGGGDEVPDGHQQERRAILHLRADRHADHSSV